MNLTVETSGTHERPVEDIGTVGRCKDNDTGIGGETIHFGEQLVQGVFPFIVCPGKSISPTGTTYRIDLVNKYDTGSLFFCLTEKITHPRSEEHTSELQSRQYLVC